MNLGLEAIREEVARNGTEADKECLAYVLDMEAGNSDKAFQGGLKRDCGEDGCVLPSRLTAEGRDTRRAARGARGGAALLHHRGFRHHQQRLARPGDFRPLPCCTHSRHSPL